MGEPEQRDKLGTLGHATLTGGARRATPSEGKDSHTAHALPRTTGEAGAVEPARHGAPSEVAEVEEDRQLNAVIKVVAYGPGGKVLARWGARAHWDGRLPITFHGSRGTAWTWSNPAARDTRLKANPDGTGGTSIEAWAQAVGATSVDVFAQAADAVTVRKDAPENDHAPGRATDERAASEDSASERDGTSSSSASTPADQKSGSGVDHADPASGVDHADPASDVDELDEAEPDPAEESLLDEIERELGAARSPDAEGDADAAGGHGKRGGDPAGHTGPGTAIGGTGPGGELARAGGDAEGSVTGRDGNGTAAGDALGVPHGSEHGLFGGEGRDGDDGVRGAGSVFGGLIAIPAALKGLVEIGLLIDAGDVTGAAGDLFKRGIGKAVSVAAARRAVAREARIYARTELKAIVKQVSASKAFRALAKEERARLMRIWLWETQRKFFRAYLKAAKAEQRAVRNALRRAKPKDLAALRVRGAAAHASEEVALAEPVAGRLPRNHAHAGKEFPRAELPPQYRRQGLRFKPNGFPEFEPFAKTLPNGRKQVSITLTGSRGADEAAANKACGFRRTPEDFTWHHVEDAGVMMLVPEDLHAAVGHSGGVTHHKHATGVAQYDN